jgi:hypothetical protein
MPHYTSSTTTKNKKLNPEDIKNLKRTITSNEIK